MGVTELAARGLVALGVAAAGTWIAAAAARRIGLLDHPGPRKPHPAPVPVSGGIGVALGVTAGLLGTGLEPAIPAGLWVLVAVGLVDDARGLRARTRLAVQAAVALPAVLASAPTMGLPRPVEVALALGWAVAVITAVKCIDCADGVAAAMAVVGALGLGALGDRAGSSAPLAAVLAGGAGGFLAWNAPPARSFLGEGGSTGLGYLLAVLALMDTGSSPAGGVLPMAIATTTVVMLPVLDFVLVHVRRVRAGVRRLADLMASAGTDHLPHRLAAAGLGPTGVAGACALAVAASALAARVGLEAGLAGSLAGAMVVITGFAVGEQVLRRRRAAPVRSPHRDGRARTRAARARSTGRGGGSPVARWSGAGPSGPA